MMHDSTSGYLAHFFTSRERAQAVCLREKKSFGMKQERRLEPKVGDGRRHVRGCYLLRTLLSYYRGKKMKILTHATTEVHRVFAELRT